MKILHVIFQMHTGGMETMLADIINEQVRLGHEVELLIVNRGENPDVMASIYPEVKISRFGRRPGANPLWLMAKLNVFVLRRRPDAIHLHMHKLCGLLRVMRRRTVFTVHDLRTPMTYAAPLRMAAISEAVAEDVRRRVAGANISVVPNGINTNLVAVREKRGLQRPVRIVQVSRLEAEKKGQDILIRAAALLKQQGIDAELTFIGDGSDRESLEALSARQGVAARFLGNLPRRQIYATLKDYDIMVQPSRYEGFGLTVAEGMAAGLPLVVTEGGGPWEVADSGRLAECFVNGSADDCARAINRVIADYPAMLLRAEKAKTHVGLLYSLRRQVAEYMELYARR